MAATAILRRMSRRILVIGAGQAAAQCIDALRRNGFDGSITLLGSEPQLPYQRPPLSKKYLAGSLEPDRLLLKHRPFYDEHQIALHLGTRAMAVDRAGQTVKDAEGRSHPYDALVLATGSRARRLAVPGAELGGVHYLRSLDDADALRSAALRGQRALIIGGGYIGLEAAATLRAMNLAVTVLETTTRLMSRVVCAPVSEFYRQEHQRHGVSIVLNAQLTELVSNEHGMVAAARCADGREYPADLVLVGIGVQAEDQLARDAGLDCANGIRVDQYCRSSDPRILAIGDCCNFEVAHYGLQVRLESVDNAFEQGTTAALQLLGTPVAHDKVPWFWSDQYDHKMLIVGLSQQHDQLVLRGDPASGAFSACYLRGGELIAIDTVNQARDQMAARRMIAARARPDPARLADPTIALKDC